MCNSRCVRCIKQNNKQQFLDNIEKWNCILGKGIEHQMLDLIKYSNVYCKMDCKVLMDGYCVFLGWMLEHTELDVDRYITIQPLASSFMLKRDCYDNVFQTSVLQQFISRCVVGGRVMTNSNKMYNVKNKPADFDACSLCPSAMYFMDGFLKGLPQILNNTSYDFFKTNQDVYCIRSKTIKLNKKLVSHLHVNLMKKVVLEISRMIWKMKLYMLAKLN